jgi:hypothetical protein
MATRRPTAQVPGVWHSLCVEVSEEGVRAVPNAPVRQP